ncbi:hypothetical protein BE20_43415 [Sorangium cellulosum]|uniref:Uncharacterized protein n=1 Tax=Sorangium cellulosum TaxID=56 RepID=A0A150SUC7_SORCE|nr:hypothetical protein BE20_43415 [Sorangium cellulosum]KYG01054.1 hypothetical protein BE18_36935 [Sorangium cellulosum]
MPRPRFAAEILRSVPPRDRAVLLRLGMDLDDPEAAKLCVEGVRAGDPPWRSRSAGSGSNSAEAEHSGLPCAFSMPGAFDLAMGP